MRSPVLVIVTGAPGTGKTTLAKQIADRFRLPLVYKDQIKELLFDELGWQNGDIGWSKKLGLTSIKLVFQMAENLLRTETSCVIENNFHPEFGTQDFLVLKDKVAYHPFQILVTCDPETLIQRVRERNLSGERHPAHPDLKDKNLASQLKTNYIDKLEIGGEFYPIDTTDFSKVNYEHLFQELDLVLDDTHRIK